MAAWPLGLGAQAPQSDRLNWAWMRGLPSVFRAGRQDTETLPCGQVTRSRFQSIVKWSRS
ncbi:hypothetical protein [Skermanella pratensis]|uniref:hypothetical protein n=1 Tax=Skermanella pratensis TaxID=2233999 RepID=UPI001300CBEE|nr:hypothetical protein [Skermanella pratensis]